MCVCFWVYSSARFGGVPSPDAVVGTGDRANVSSKKKKVEEKKHLHTNSKSSKTIQTRHCMLVFKRKKHTVEIARTLVRSIMCSDL